MTFTQFCIKFLALVSLFSIGFGFAAWSLLMQTGWIWLIIGGFVVLLLSAFAEWIDESQR